jgi:hypothetical protein
MDTSWLNPQPVTRHMIRRKHQFFLHDIFLFEFVHLLFYQIGLPQPISIPASILFMFNKISMFIPKFGIILKIFILFLLALLI